MGFDDPAPLGRGETGGESALRLWTAFMGQALAGKPEARLPVPPGMVQVWVDKTSGGRVGPGDPGAIAEWVRDEDEGSLAGPNPVSYTEGYDAGDGMPPSIIDEVF